MARLFDDASKLMTWMDVEPSVPDGEEAEVMHVIVVELTTFTLVAETMLKPFCPPICTIAPVRKLDPVIVMDVPPWAEPEFGETENTLGAGVFR